MDLLDKKLIDDLLKELPNKIEAQAELTLQKNFDYKNAKAGYKAQYNKVYLQSKLKDKLLTQGDLKAMAEAGAEDARVAMVVAHSAYESAKIVLQRLRDELDNTRERSYNYRAEVKQFR